MQKKTKTQKSIDKGQLKMKSFTYIGKILSKNPVRECIENEWF